MMGFEGGGGSVVDVNWRVFQAVLVDVRLAFRASESVRRRWWIPKKALRLAFEQRTGRCQTRVVTAKKVGGPSVSISGEEGDEDMPPFRAPVFIL